MLIEQIHSAEGIDKAKSFLLFSMRSAGYGFEKISYADSGVSSIGTQSGGLVISISVASDLRLYISPNLNKHPSLCGLVSWVTQQSGGATTSHTGGST
jgi:hypothetical protein